MTEHYKNKKQRTKVIQCFLFTVTCCVWNQRCSWYLSLNILHPQNGSLNESWVTYTEEFNMYSYGTESETGILAHLWRVHWLFNNLTSSIWISKLLSNDTMVTPPHCQDSHQQIPYMGITRHNLVIYHWCAI